MTAPPAPLRAALFVDFDNIFISFDNLDPRAGRRFATRPAEWLRWFEAGRHDPAADGMLAPRRILVRKCYLNPQHFGAFRGDFTRAAFQIVDCPPLTTRGKTSTDIFMVMDVMDALEHPTRFDEFILLSADADFTPVLLRLRAHDRRTTILCTDLAAAAYKAACDRVVAHDHFFEDALGLDEANGEAGPEDDQGHDLQAVAAAIREAVEQQGMIAASDLPILLQRFEGFRGSNWFGQFSLRALAVRLSRLEPALAVSGDPRGVWYVGPARPARGGRAGPRPRLAAAALAEAAAAPAEDAALPAEDGESRAFIRRVADVTGVPHLPRELYLVLYGALTQPAEAARASPHERAHAIQERLAAAGITVTRAQIAFMLAGFRYHGFEPAGADAATIAREWLRNVLSLCAGAQLPLGPADERRLAAWLLPPEAEDAA
jgi:hypothetical protein